MRTQPDVETGLGTRERILDAAAGVFVARGWHAAGMREVADAAGLAVSSLYNHFASKESLFAAVLDRSALEVEIEGIRGYVGLEDFPRNLEGLVELVRRLAGNHEVFVRLAIIDLVEFGGRHVSGLAFDISPVVEAVLRPGYEHDLAEGLIRDFDLETVTRFIHLALFGYFAMTALAGRPARVFRDEATENREIARLLERGLLTDPEASG